ncbi:hypothetical protein Patl1_21701 [Pistacia atlantica]|uniref:Uncharacterized protein n=1 Tax=Pistacia atlantica TaxID=434234 RepID=A0ACC1BN97_9ROSI|nr:hypothetical protein Patl1_21701 [Pistacia atlantica]
MNIPHVLIIPFPAQGHVIPLMELSQCLIPEAMEPWEDRNDIGRLCEVISKVLPGKLEELIEDDQQSGSRIDCLCDCGWEYWFGY